MDITLVMRDKFLLRIDLLYVNLFAQDQFLEEKIWTVKEVFQVVFDSSLQVDWRSWAKQFIIRNNSINISSWWKMHNFISIKKLSC